MFPFLVIDASAALALLLAEDEMTLVAILTFRFPEGKGNISRLVPIGQYTTLYIEEYLKKGRKILLRGFRSDPGNLSLTRFGNPFDRKSINKSVVKPIQKRSKLKKNLTV